MPTGKCSLRGGVKIVFPVSGVGVVPYEVNTHDAVGDWRRLRSQISLQAGRHIVENVEENEPAFLKVAGNVINRYIYKNQSIELQDDRANLNLRDVMYQYNDVHITENYQDNETIAYIISDLLQTANSNISNHGAIQGIKTDEGLTNADVDYYSQSDRLEKLEIRALWQGSRGGYDWDEDTVNSALKEIAKDHNVDFTTTRNGYFVMGNVAFTKPIDNSAHLISGDQEVDSMRLREYNVTQTGKKIRRTSAKGAVVTGAELFELLQSELSNVNFEGESVTPDLSAELRPWATTYAPDVEDGITKSTQQLNGVKTISETRTASVNDLYNSWGGYTNGNIVFNAGTSTQEGQERLSYMDPGDIIEVVGNQRPGNDSFEGDEDSLCGHKIYPGVYSVNTIKHKFNDRVGWETMVQTGLLPPDYREDYHWIDEKNGNVYRSLYDFATQSEAEPGEYTI